MRFDDPPGDREAEPGALRVARSGRPEGVEDVARVLFGNPRAGIGDGEPDLVLFRLGADGDRPFRRGELDGVGEQVGDNLEESILVRGYVRERRGDPALEADT